MEPILRNPSRSHVPLEKAITLREFADDWNKRMPPDQTCLHDLFNPPRCSMFNDIAIIIDDDKGNVQIATYDEVDCAAKAVERKLRQYITSGFVLVSCPLNRIFPSIQLGVMRAGCGVYNVGEKNVVTNLEFSRKILGAEFAIFLDQEFMQYSEWVLKNSENQEYIEVIFRGESVILRLVQFSKPQPNTKSHQIEAPVPFEYAYAISTSGSTGAEKLVMVPHACIVPNVRTFIRNVWNLGSQDVIFGCSPSTFDPSVIELFGALGCGGTILYVPDEVKLDGVRLGRTLLRHKTTVLQITPSLLRRVGADLKAVGFFDSSKTTLKRLALGGERCLLKEELRLLIDRSMFKKLESLLNLYGVTEHSCWASFARVNPYDDSFPVFIGSCMAESQISLDSLMLDEESQFSEILIGSSTRTCTVVDNSGNIISNRKIQAAFPRTSSRNFPPGVKYIIRTGDYGYKFNIGPRDSELCYLGRIDRIVKKNGMKLGLVTIEEMAMKSLQVQTAECVAWENKVYLLVVMREASSTLLGLGRNVRAKFIPGLFLDIPPQFYPDCIIGVHSIPVNSNGKIDIKWILNSIEDHTLSAPGVFSLEEGTIIRTLIPIWLRATRNNRHDNSVITESTLLRENFFAAGGDSLAAAWFVETSCMVLNLAGTTLQNEMESMLFKKLFVSTFGSCCRFIKDAIDKQPLTATVGLVSSETIVGASTSCKSMGVLSGQSLKENCKDYNNYRGPKTFHSISSENAGISCRDVINNGLPRSLAKFDVDVMMCVDANPSFAVKGQFAGVVIAASHSGHVVAIDLMELRLVVETRDREASSGSGGVLWTTVLPGRVEAAAEFNDEASFVYIGCHDHSLYKLSVVNGTVCSSFACLGVVRSKPAVDSKMGYVTVVDDQNTIYCLKSKDLTLLWKTAVLGGISATSAPVCSRGLLFLTTMRSGLMALNGNDGTLQWPDGGYTIDAISGPLIACVHGKVQVIVATVDGAEGRSVRSGEVLWRYKEKEVWGPQPPLMPQIHLCDYMDKLEILVTSRTGKVVCINQEGKKVSEIKSGNPDIPSTVICTRKVLDKEIECYCLTKSINRDTFTLNRLTDGNSEIPDICLKMGFRIFSVPCTYNEFLMFGGRDNNLHLTCFNSSSVRDYPYIRPSEKKNNDGI